MLSDPGWLRAVQLACDLAVSHACSYRPVRCRVVPWVCNRFALSVAVIAPSTGGGPVDAAAESTRPMTSSLPRADRTDTGSRTIVHYEHTQYTAVCSLGEA